MSRDEEDLDRFDHKIDARRKHTKRKTEENAAYGGIFDKYASENLQKLQNMGIITKFVGTISAGKEANIYFGFDQEELPIAIKIYKIDPQSTKWMKNYIIGDPRFNKIGTSTHKIIYTWCKKEFKNLKTMFQNGINVPQPLLARDNILLMRFIGDNNGTPAPRLKDVRSLDSPNLKFHFILDQIKTMYQKAHLVHGDLSEYNILSYNDQLVIIDVSQAVSIYHPNAAFYLSRDLENILRYFSNYIQDTLDFSIDKYMADIVS